ncbi:Putative F0F1-ATPase subunit (ATPase_gene1) [Calycomorphotria hydatis]|uniref:F0F1-ATPase subunit (ATPase_gene1) n=2 Tax=Calycomorphotria hydatis TaxID=2528027 RepID=A0A517T6G2_9PLAN|nr:Putative F0F1-ATPase subunit (ATPase_gene1) [Calycomorphotria hydatis]
MALPPLLGYWLDLKFNTQPWLTVILAFFGFAVSMMHLMQMVMQMQADSNKFQGESKQHASESEGRTGGE